FAQGRGQKKPVSVENHTLRFVKEFLRQDQVRYYSEVPGEDGRLVRVYLKRGFFFPVVGVNYDCEVEFYESTRSDKQKVLIGVAWPLRHEMLSDEEIIPAEKRKEFLHARLTFRVDERGEPIAFHRGIA